MSAFLGPIHHWLYRKIRLQDELTKTLLDAFPDRKTELLAELDSRYGTLPTGELADLIDGGNIHGWLQERVTLVEQRLAYTAAALGTDERSREQLKIAAFVAGEANKLEAATPAEAFKALQDVLLDGMPCDRVNEVRESDDNAARFERVRDLHSAFYTELGADPALFDEIRSAWVSGMLDGTGLRYTREGNLFTIGK